MIGHYDGLVLFFNIVVVFYCILLLKRSNEASSKRALVVSGLIYCYGSWALS